MLFVKLSSHKKVSAGSGCASPQKRSCRNLPANYKFFLPAARSAHYRLYLKFGGWALPILMPAITKGGQCAKQVCGPRAKALKRDTVSKRFIFIMLMCWDAVPINTKRQFVEGTVCPLHGQRTTVFIKVRRRGTAHPHARNYKRWATHKASMRASCGCV